MRNKPLSILIIVTMLAVLLAACGPTPEPQTIVQTVEVEKTVVETVEVEKEVTVVETVEVETEVTVVETVEVEVTPVVEEDPTALPREETLYFNGQQWGAVVGWNPYSNSNNNAMAIAQQDNARVIM
ncbi:MAG: hypothetical protein PVF67_02420, partial [Anaerolineae bacterium]